MIHDHDTLALIEVALEATPWCATCGMPTTVVERRGELWLECLSLTKERSPLAAAFRRLALHERQRLLTAEEATIAA